MDNNSHDLYSFKEIPKEFHSDLDKKPFCACTFCGSNLQSEVEPYMIEKSIKVNPNNGTKNTVIEYAICMKCSRKKMAAMSVESVQNIQNYMMENFVMEEWEKQAQLGSDPFAKCLVTGVPVEELEEYNIVGQFIGDKMLLGQFPILISPSIGDEIQELLSQQTKDEFDDFMDTITNVPPELKELFKTKRPVLV